MGGGLLEISKKNIFILKTWQKMVTMLGQFTKWNPSLHFSFLNCPNFFTNFCRVLKMKIIFFYIPSYPPPIAVRNSLTNQFCHKNWHFCTPGEILVFRVLVHVWIWPDGLCSVPSPSATGALTTDWPVKGPGLLAPSIQLCCTALYCIAQHCTALHCTALYWTALHCTVLHYTVLYCTVLLCTVLHCTLLLYTALHFTELHCITLFSPKNSPCPRVTLLTTLLVN